MTSSAPTAPAMTFAERYRAISARDTRFDGQFVTAVRSTGIYCRPSCPARTPKVANVTFYPTSAAAHEAGYRACKRCLPEATPGSPAWNLRGDAAARAMRLIAAGVVEQEGVGGLANRLGYSPRHLTRLLTAELGAGPLALARAHRAHTARMLLVGTDMPISEVAFSAGFASIRQCNDTIREVFEMTPGQLRATRRRKAGGTEADAAAQGAIELLLPHRAPMDAAGVFAWMAARALPGVEHATATSFARHLRMPGGPAQLEVRQDAEGRLRLRARVSGLGDLAPLVAVARRLFDLDADPAGVDAALSSHPELSPLVAAIPGIRVPGSADPHEMLIRAMVGQQITVAAARTALTALAEQLGERTADGGILFPTMAAIAEHGAEVLRGPAARIRAITGAAAALTDGSVVLTVGDDAVEQRTRLLAMPGIGPWTADYVRMRVIGDPDVLLPGDVAVRAGAAASGLPSGPRGLSAWAERVAPWRSYLTAHLWRAAPVRAPRRRTTANKETS
ncbi:Ada metal-binding domain-containing protein [Microbacterium sp. ARD32]|uniref:DNA-3-methyladenine glycosylase 2 family protein n=1 Tax=Microbacterium sp. ARD32 TaxID=2962577 RepID=UPI002881EF13|nr:Ada metal-binding domain-containing protein [Microbacterium sp. ARD32]MDT0156482.1 Ada metal-binding domain-containing protein [Microbacterium sp. ARD32]